MVCAPRAGAVHGRRLNCGPGTRCLSVSHHEDLHGGARFCLFCCSARHLWGVVRRQKGRWAPVQPALSRGTGVSVLHRSVLYEKCPLPLDHRAWCACACWGVCLQCLVQGGAASGAHCRGADRAPWPVAASRSRAPCHASMPAGIRGQTLGKAFAARQHLVGWSCSAVSSNFTRSYQILSLPGQEDPEGRPLGWTSQRGTCPREQSQAPGADGPKDKRLKHLRVLELKGQRACQGELWAEGELVFVHRVCVTIWVRVRHNEATIKTMTDHARAPLCCMQSVCWPRSDTLLRILTF